MQNTLKNCLQTVRKNRRFRMRGISVLLILSLFVSLNVFWGLRQTGLTLAGTAECGYSEHTHTDECYNRILICTLSETGHTHTDDCYLKQLICDKTEHVHTLDCYSDTNADVETQLDWQKMFDGIITGDKRADLVAVARSQIGYKESERNFVTDGDLVRRGYTRYGAWYGSPYGEWTAMFISFCLHYAGIDETVLPYNTGTETMLKSWDNAGHYAKAADHSPQSGDVVFLSDGTAGIISSVDYSTLYVITGDVHDSVCEQTVSTYDDVILGYGTLDTVAKHTNLSADSGRVATDFVLQKCDCGNVSADAISHSDECAYKSQLKTVANTYTSLEIYDIWPVLHSDAREYILYYLSYSNSKKAAAINELNANGSTTVRTSCEGATFSVKGALPKTVTLSVSKPEYTKQTLLAYLNPNIKDSVNSCVIYNISLHDGDDEYQPSSQVLVKISLPDITFDEQNELFAVAHIDAETGEITDSVYVDFNGGNLSFVTDGFSPYMFYTVDKEVEGGERILGTNWISLKDSGYFTYWQMLLTDGAGSTLSQSSVMAAATDGNASSGSSQQQINNEGGTTTSTKGDGVEISKTIAGTDIENVFDITLTVKTSQSISELYEKPNMAVVIVMDISNTMNDNFGGVTRYAAALEAAEDFLDRFADETGDASYVGYVAFNTDAHEIFGLTKCSNQTEANALKNTMRTQTGNIINANGYGVAHNRFTNVEAGLKMGSDMLASVQNDNKYIIFLSDGFPTTYIESGYKGYDPYDTTGRFYDHVLNVPCSSGTSYSDEAAIRARNMAANIKQSGITIFSIGVDVSGQTIQKYIETSETLANGTAQISVVDRTGTTYEIGDATSTEAYKNWLKNSIGSGYYYDSTNTAGLKEAYGDIFEKIKQTTEAASKADWVANDPIPLAPPEYLEFIGFYDKNKNLLPTGTALIGTTSENGENEAIFTCGSGTQNDLSHIDWDLKLSGYTTQTDGDRTYYYYSLVYRVRLKNELDGFVENKVYETNATTTLTYRVFESQNGVTTLSEQRTLEFKIPSVHGYLADLVFTKKGSDGKNLAGAVFELIHDDTNCPVCRGDGTKHVEVPKYTAISDSDGTVTFNRIPSGHKYILKEVKAPPGYIRAADRKVTVAYDVITVDGESPWNEVIIDKTSPEFPQTGGMGIAPFIFTGALLVLLPVICCFVRIRHRKRERGSDG